MSFSIAMNGCANTANGAVSYNSPDISNKYTGRISLFFKGVRGLNIPSLYNFLETSSKESLIDTFVLVFILRDPRNGKGERELGRHAMKWLSEKHPFEFKKVVKLIPEYGRWDDLLFLFPNQDAVSLMASQLKLDLTNMKEGKPVSLCAKWTPTEGDKSDTNESTFTILAKALKVSHKTLRQKFNTPLRAYLKIVETYICRNQWSEVKYNAISSRTMHLLKKSFEEHDSERFNEWKENLVSGKSKVNAKVLLPHELVKQLRSGTSDSVVEAQWKVLVNEVRKLGSLQDVIAVVDTSGSMMIPNYIPIDVAVALGMIISEVVQGPFHGQLITFQSNPSFAVIPDSDLQTRYNSVSRMKWGGSTNLESVFTMILNSGKACSVPPEDMPKKILIISDMQFNSCSSLTNLERINQLYSQSGYTRPNIIFWNVAGSSGDFPATVTDNGTCLISGFSPNILKSIINGTDINSISILRSALDDKRYDCVRDLLM